MSAQSEEALDPGLFTLGGVRVLAIKSASSSGCEHVRIETTRPRSALPILLV